MIIMSPNLDGAETCRKFALSVFIQIEGNKTVIISVGVRV